MFRTPGPRSCTDDSGDSMADTFALNFALTLGGGLLFGFLFHILLLCCNRVLAYCNYCGGRRAYFSRRRLRNEMELALTLRTDLGDSTAGRREGAWLFGSKITDRTQANAESEASRKISPTFDSPAPKSLVRCKAVESAQHPSPLLDRLVLQR